MRARPVAVMIGAMLLALILALGGDDFAAYRAATSVETPCSRARSPGEVTVCSRREADRRYRVPFVSIPVRDDVPRERAELLADKIDHCGRRWNLTDCGFIGVTMTAGAASTRLTTRKLKD